MMTARLFPLALALAAVPMLAWAHPRRCPQFFPGGAPPALANPRLAQRTTLLCNAAYAVLASGVTHGAIWSAERPSAATVADARDTQREGRFYPEDRLPFADQAQLDDYRRSGFDRGHMTPSGDMPGGPAQQQSFSLANMVPQTHLLGTELLTSRSKTARTGSPSTARWTSPATSRA
jgi:endonuclease G